jgi:ribosomal protein S18 acetylase RimI-like enzyme
MKLRLQKGITGVDFKDVAALIEAVGWGIRDPEQMNRAFNRSKAVFVFDGSTLIGMGRCITDDEYYATIWDVIVKPGYQRQGIGGKIVAALLEDEKDRQFIALTSTPGNEPFYSKFGFRLQKTAMVILNIPEYPEEETNKLVY